MIKLNLSLEINLNFIFIYLFIYYVTAFGRHRLGYVWTIEFPGDLPLGPDPDRADATLCQHPAKSCAGHIVLREDQLEIMLGSLEDYSVDVREGLHLMLGACRVSTQTCLLMVVQKLLDVLSKYPQDRHSTYACMRKIGQKHPHLVMAVTGHLLYVHPFFETPERDVEDPAYLCVLILVFNAAEHLVPIISLLPTATHRHYAYLRDSMPKLVPQLPIEGASSSSTTKRIDDALQAAGSSAEYLQMILNHIGEIFTKTDERVELLKTAQSNLQVSSQLPQLPSATLA